MLPYLRLILSMILAIAKFPWTSKGKSGRRRPEANRMSDARRSWRPVVAATLIALILGAGCVHLYYRLDFHYSGDASTLKLVHHKVFENQVVPLDGQRYVACVFRNVTFEYDGSGPYQLESNHFQGSLGLTTRNRSISAAVTLLKGLGMTTVPIFDNETGQELRDVELPKFAAGSQQPRRPAM